MRGLVRVAHTLVRTCRGGYPCARRRSSRVGHAATTRRDDLVNQDYTLVEEAQDLAARPLAARLLVVHDAERRREDEVAELARRQ